MTPPSPPRSLAGALGGTGAAGAAWDGGAGLPAASPSRAAPVAPDGRRRRRLRGAPVPATLSGLTTGAAGAAAIAGVSAGWPFAPAGRRLRRLRGAAVAPVAADPVAAGGSAARSRSLGARWRLTLAPTSPSAQSVPSAVWTSTRQTTIEVGAAPIGGRFCVSVQRAKIVSPAWTARGNFQFSHSHSSTEGTGMSIVPSPTATATRRAGGATRTCPGAASMERGEKSPETPANRAISASEMVRRRVVHSPPSGRSSKERGSRSARV
jgi:hypothetical protein